MAAETWCARQAALLLHGLPGEACDRVLARLGHAEAARLKPLLVELTELDIPRSLGAQWRWLAPGSRSAPASTDCAAASVQEQVQALAAGDVAQCLKACAPVTVAALLRAGRWPWQRQVLDGMPEPRRAEIMRILAEDAALAAPAVVNALCARLCAEVARSRAHLPHDRSSTPNPMTGLLKNSLRAGFGRPAEIMRSLMCVVSGARRKPRFARATPEKPMDGLVRQPASGRERMPRRLRGFLSWKR